MPNVSRLIPPALAGAAYAVAGVATADLAKGATSIQSRNGWRLAAWVLSALVFMSHVAYERLRARETVPRTARHAAGAVALGAFLLAAAGPVRAHWADEHFWRVTALSLVLWPVLTGIPAFLAALFLASVLGRIVARE